MDRLIDTVGLSHAFFTLFTTLVCSMGFYVSLKKKSVDSVKDYHWLNTLYLSVDNIVCTLQLSTWLYIPFLVDCTTWGTSLRPQFVLPLVTSPLPRSHSFQTCPSAKHLSTRFYAQSHPKACETKIKMMHVTNFCIHRFDIGLSIITKHVKYE